MTIGLPAILDAVVSHAAASGHFDRIGRHEPKSAPGTGLSAAIWVDRVSPLPGASGLAQTSALVVLNIRVYTNMLADPPDDIDPSLMSAVDGLMTAYSGDFDLGGTVRNVDLLGAYSAGLSAQAGYLEQDGRLYRVMTVTLPLVVSDVWSQNA
ncbi:MAG TPA: hypothetical protein VIV12_06625 [Streptosporangiaceae bacterium]